MTANAREDYQAFVESLHETGVSAITVAPYDFWFAAQEKYEPKWISVNDQRPKLGQRVLVFSNGVVQEDIFMYDEDDDGTFWSSELLDEFPPCAHSDFWMALPSSPALPEGER